MTADNLVIVESPAKAKTIHRYLGDRFEVLASYGHVRDLSPRDGSVRPAEDFAMDWELGKGSKRHVDAIAKAAGRVKTVYLATDPDREGEAISWHMREVLRGRDGLSRLDFRRITFHEITRHAVTEALASPRDVNQELVQAYLARRALDYLVGFTISPVLWRKLPGSKSAGRVQSVALRLIAEREAEIESFRPRTYFTIEGHFTTADGRPFQARLNRLDDKKLTRFAFEDRGGADAVAADLAGRPYHVATVDKRRVKRNPAPPFTTSTLQQEASRKLGFGTTATMRTAQRLYEGVDVGGGDTIGLITYMRTDGTTLAEEALAATRAVIGSQFGADYLPDRPRRYKTKAKNAQEAHEAIRPTDPGRKPVDLAHVLKPAELRLYELIWKRTLACQMTPAEIDQVSVMVDAAGRDAAFRASGSTVAFDGFLRLYQEGRDDAEPEAEKKGAGPGLDGDRRLPPMSRGEAAGVTGVSPEEHATQPPPRYTEASLVKRMEELGIGRPSTYASILQVLQDRTYVRLEKKRFFTEDRGRLVTSFLTAFFSRYVEYDFTAKLEDQLDDISGGRADWKAVLQDFWLTFSEAVDKTKDLSISAVIDVLDEELGPHFFPQIDPDRDPRTCPTCGQGRLGIRLARSGPFVGCSVYPDCRHTQPLEVVGGDRTPNVYPRDLGEDPDTGLTISVRKGPFGFYVQRAAPTAEEKPRRVGLTKDLSPDDVDFAMALALLALPRHVGLHPQSGKPILAGIGRYGPYLQHDGAYRSLPAGEDVLTVGINRAVDLLATGRKTAAGLLREVGAHAADGKPITLHNGRFGPYVKHGSVMASLPKGVEPADIDRDQAMALIAAKAERNKADRGGKGKAKGGKSGSGTAAAKSRAKPGTAPKSAAKSTPKTRQKSKPASSGKAAGKATRGSTERTTAAGSGDTESVS